jgi:hypothetical protein
LPPQHHLASDHRPFQRTDQGQHRGKKLPRETDAIVNVVRCFEDDNVIHVANKVDPIADAEVILT